MASAWSFSRRSGVDSASRVVSALSLDGALIRCRVIARFQRPVPREVAESVADDAMAAVAAIIGEELSQGRIPFTAPGLATRLRSRLSGRDARAATFRIEELELLPSRVGGSRTMPASMSPDAGRTERAPRTPHDSGLVPAVHAPPTLKSPPPTMMPSPSPPTDARIKTLWQTALVACQPGADADQLGRLLVPAVRDSVAQLILRGILALDPGVADRLALLTGTATDPPLAVLQRHACACVAVAFRRVLTGAELPKNEATEIAETACRRAMAPEPFPSAEFSRYMVSDAPLRHLSTHFAGTLGANLDAQRIYGALTKYTDVLRTDFVVAAREVARARSR